MLQFFFLIIPMYALPLMNPPLSRLSTCAETEVFIGATMFSIGGFHVTQVSLIIKQVARKHANLNRLPLNKLSQEI